MRIFLLLCMLIVSNKAALRNINWTPLQTITNSAELFSMKFYQTVSQEESGNLVISPLSVDVLLSMAALGASGNTKKEMHHVLNLPAGEHLIKSGYQSLIDNLNNIRSVELKVASKIFTSNSVVVKPAFKSMTAEIFRSESEQVDFSDSTRAAFTINSWCAHQTGNKIQNIVTPDSLDENSAMVLINAVYFKGQWMKPFHPSNTCERDFYIDEQTIKKVPTMFQMGHIRYDRLPHLNATLVQMPYVGKKVSMIIVLPDEIDGLSEVEKKLEHISITVLKEKASIVPLRFFLPRFRIESSIELNNVLSKMGMRKMFSNEADFSGISENRLKVSKVLQKAFIQVDEKGSEASAASSMFFVSDSMGGDMPPIYTFDVNKPFMYYLIENSSGNSETVLFKGKVMDPTQE